MLLYTAKLALSFKNLNKGLKNILKPLKYLQGMDLVIYLVTLKA